jgi:pyruvate,water dikinase
MTDPITFIVPLAQATDRDLVGGKAAELARLLGAGFPVPEGFVITTAAHRLASADGQAVPPAVAAALVEQLTDFSTSLAYRSSAVAEDLASASFAGQYESVLNVRGADAGLEALQACWDSAGARHLDAYRDSMAAGSSAEMAVLVQRMIDADTSGVAFGADPVTGRPRIIIEAIAGTGERLLAGEVTPERWTIGEETEVDRLDTGPLLDDAQAAEIADICRRIENLYGAPQDIEWAYAGGRLHLLQSRPITALPIEPAERPPEDQSWLLSDGFFPEPVLPLSYSTWLPRHSASWAYVFEKLGVPVETVGHGRYFGRVYDRMIPLGNPAKDRPLPPRPILKLAEDWESAGRTTLRTENRRLLDVELAALDDGGLADHLEAVLDHVLAAGIAHFEMAAASFASAGSLGMHMEELLGWRAERVTDLLQGYGGSSIEDGESIRAAAAAYRSDPNRHHLLDDPTLLLADPGPMGEILRDFLDRVGHRTVGQDLSQPTWGEDPAPVVHLIRHHLQHQEILSDPRAAAARAEEEARAEIRDPESWDAFSTSLQRARRLRPYQDETEPDVAAATGLVRLVALEAAGRLLAEGAIDHHDDVFYLETDELVAAIRTRQVQADLERRKAEHRWALANPAPRLLGPEPGPPPPAEVFPAAVRTMVGAFLWSVANSIGMVEVDQGSGDGLRGLPASPGRATGTVRVIRSAGEFERIRAGDIVVCTMTMAAWSPIFPVISGLVTEQGGPLSHPGTLAREYGLPAVLSVPGATSLFNDGDRITIDGGTGVIEMV